MRLNLAEENTSHPRAVMTREMRARVVEKHVIIDTPIIKRRGSEKSREMYTYH